MMNNQQKRVVIIGAGLAGCTMARLFADEQYQVDLYEIKDYVGGNLYDCYNDDGILIHQYGPHIFHTNDDVVWKFVNRFSHFHNYLNQVLVDVNHQLVELPINLNSIKQLFPNEYETFYQDVTEHFQLNTSVTILALKEKLTNPISKQIVDYLFDNVYKNYTMKMWGLKVEELDPQLFSRVKINLDTNWNYFPDDQYQAIPSLGYSELIKNMINDEHIHLHLKTNGLEFISFNKDKILFNDDANVIVIYTGMIDELFNYCFGHLEYRSLQLIFETYQKDSFQPTAVVNYPSDPIITRITEYKKLTLQEKVNITTISKEIPGQYDVHSSQFNTPFYPINNIKNNTIKDQYLKHSEQFSNLILVGRLAQYRYYDMDDVIDACFKIFNDFKQKH